MPNVLPEQAQSLLDSFRAEVGTVLKDADAQSLQTLHQQADLLEQALQRSTEVRAGFIGESQVGKSTLINALLGRKVLPQAGIGPLTATATRVRNAPEDSFTAVYQSRKQLNNVAFGLERMAAIAATSESVIAADQIVVDIPLEADPIASSEADVTPTPPLTKARGELLMNRVQLLLGDEGSRLSAGELARAVRCMLDPTKLVEEVRLQPFADRIAQIAARVGTTETVRAGALPGGSKEFAKALDLRASEWMAPLIEKLEVGLSDQSVEGMVYVDLPGVGVKGDARALAALDFVEQDANALVIVFRNSGMTDAIASMLESTGVITKLLFGSRTGAPPLRVIIAVTQLDNVAQSHWQAARDEAEDDGRPAPLRDHVFADLAAKMRDKMRSDVRAALLGSSAFESVGADERQQREQVVHRLCDELEIFPVAAPDYLLHVRGRAGEAWLREAPTTNIPHLRIALQELHQDAVRRRASDIRERALALRSMLDVQHTILREGLEPGKGAARAGWDEFCAVINDFAAEMRDDVREISRTAAQDLRRTIPERLDTLCEAAGTSGYRRLSSLRKHSEGLHYQSLYAALRNDGVWERRELNYPDAITRSIVDTIASSWQKNIIAEVNRIVCELADQQLALVADLVATASVHHPAVAEDQMLRARQKALRAGSRTAIQFTGDNLEELTDEVATRLRKVVERPIAKACETALANHHHAGAGAKTRIIRDFEEGGQQAVDAAKLAAREVLQKAYRKVLQTLENGILQEFNDPLTSVVEQLTQQTGDFARRSDAARRSHEERRVEAFAQWLSALPAIEPGDADLETAA